MHVHERYCSRFVCVATCVCLCVCYHSSASVQRVCDKLNLPAINAGLCLANSISFQLADFAKSFQSDPALLISIQDQGYMIAIPQLYPSRRFSNFGNYIGAFSPHFSTVIFLSALVIIFISLRLHVGSF